MEFDFDELLRKILLFQIWNIQQRMWAKLKRNLAESGKKRMIPIKL